MSGPKAFRVVTREEIVAICTRHLALLDAAVEAWTVGCRRNGTARQGDVDRVVARRDELRRLLAADRFVELQKQVPAEISYLRADAGRRADGAVEAEVRSRRDLRRMKGTAEALVAKLEESEIRVSADILVELRSSRSPEQLEAAINKAFLLLYPTARPGAASPGSRELAARLGEGERRETLAEWMSRQAPVVEDEALHRVDVLLAELGSLGIDPTLFSRRIADLERESASRRALLADSVIIDLATAVKGGRERLRAAEELRDRLSELSTSASDDAASLRTEIENHLARTKIGDAADLSRRAVSLVEAELKALAAAARRRTVLDGLSALGYQVTEGMETAWAERGNVVLRKQSDPAHGVELAGGGPQSDVLQVRAVALGDPSRAREAADDRETETIWCGEFDRLKALVAQSGGELAVQHARPIGQYPLKTIAIEPATYANNVDRKGRTLR